jgi:hypothetical protein
MLGEGSPLYKVVERMKEAAESAIDDIRDEDDMQVFLDQLDSVGSAEIGSALWHCMSIASEDQARSLNAARFSWR